MWQIISNISAIVTCITFLLYLIGRVLVVIKNKRIFFEKLSVIPLDSKIDIDDEDNSLIIDKVGCEFTLQSEYGINNLDIYKVDYNINEDGTLQLVSKTLKKSYKNLNKDTLFIRCDLGETVPTTHFEIRRSDYTIISFDIMISGKTGRIITYDSKQKLTIKGFLHHLCV